MKNIKQQAAIYLQLGTFVTIWLVIIYFTKPDLSIDPGAIKKLPEVVMVYGGLYFVFTKWVWRIPILQGWLIPFPDLQGTWQGTLQTTWKDPETEASLEAIPAVLVVRQSFTSISCALHTNESVSYSNAALVTEDENKVKKLSFNYTNRPGATIRDRSGIHDGAAILHIITTPGLELRGEYWTNRKTTGEMAFTFRSKQLLEVFPSDLSANR